MPWKTLGWKKNDYFPVEITVSDRSERLTVLTTEEAEYRRRDFKLCATSFGPMSSACGTARTHVLPERVVPAHRTRCHGNDACPQCPVPPVTSKTPEASAQVRTGALSRSTVSLRRRDYTSGSPPSPLPSKLKLLGNCGAAHACEPVGSAISSKLEPTGLKSSTLSLQLKMRHDDDDRVVGIPTVVDTNLNICRQLTEYCHNHNSDRRQFTLPVI
ncbi:hypothetical protein C0Q70_06438 [Pomacea canaliculata]|uniref:Uncharacterized protein n=1 Tax=Pomacea canaliculata TaxID=400727 RepID=A0A2T7PP56_POMCA|nr:hypothetical protein C0Q70_06438 [Pomacea canaliculata]